MGLGVYRRLIPRIRDILYPDAIMTFREMLLLKKTFGKDKLIVEVGSYKGGTTRQLAKKNRVIAIEPFLGGYHYKDGISCRLERESQLQKIKNRFLDNIKDKPVTWINMKSEAAIKNWNTEVDGIFIDGEHTYEALERDTQWIKHIKKGGLIAFHDAGDERYPGVLKFIKEKVVPHHKLIARVDHLWIFKK